MEAVILESTEIQQAEAHEELIQAVRELSSIELALVGGGQASVAFM